MAELIQKSIKTLKEDGLLPLTKKTIRYVGKKIIGASEEVQEQPIEVTPAKKPSFVDVLFINGCDSSVPHPARYRVTHQREQLIANNVTSDEVYYIDLQIEQVKYAHLFIFFRCPYTDTIGEFIKTARKLNKTVLFDIDDLVVDTKYTDTIKYIQQMTPEEKQLYDDGVNRMGKTLNSCQGAVTTTERLANELGKYVPEVYINRNTASERMYELSEKAEKRQQDDEVRIGYFSGSITHNDDFKLVLPAIVEILRKYDNTRLYIVGELELPDDLKPFEKQVVVSPFMDWQELPQLIASVDINLGPLEQSIFNEAKSENKWVEAALVKVPTVASNVGAFARMIEHEVTGFLCDSEKEWLDVLENLVNSRELRKKVAENAYSYVKEHCLTVYTGYPFTKYIKQKMSPSVIFVFPSTEISGGIMVALKHASFMQKHGYDVSILAYSPSLEWMEYDGCRFPVLEFGGNEIFAAFDKAIATMWTTTPFIETHPGISERYYLVQNFETDFYEPNIILRIRANQTYNLGRNINYITISRWCQRWLKEKFDKESSYAPNGINQTDFKYQKRDFTSKKIRILIEGDCAVEYKKVDESFQVVELLDKDRFEIWYMSYNESPKEWYYVDKFLHRVPYKEVPKVYQECHILLKSSVLESFSYPPLEMMATGGFVVVTPNGGNVEYLKDDYNCLFYESGNIEQAAQCIERICQEEALRGRIESGARETAEKRQWESVEKEILSMYGIE